MIRKNIFLMVALTIFAVVLLSCGNADTRGSRALDNFKEAVAAGRVEKVETFSSRDMYRAINLPAEDRNTLLELIRETGFVRSLEKNVESPGTPDLMIKITLDDGKYGSIEYLGAGALFIYLEEYGWFIRITNENLGRWLMEYAEQ